MKKIKLITLIVFVLLSFFYSIVYFYVKYKHSPFKKPDSYLASIFVSVDRVNSVYFDINNKFDVALYNFFLPASKVEKIFNKELGYYLSDLIEY